MNNNIFKQSASLLKKNLMIIQPLLLCVMIIMLMFIPLLSKAVIDISFILTVILAGLCTTAFLSGWLNSVVYIVSLKNKKFSTLEEQKNSQIEILKKFFPGVADYIIPVSIVSIIYFGIGIGMIEIYRIIVKKLMLLNKFPVEFLNIINSGQQNEINNYIQNSLNNSQIATLLYIIAGSFIAYLIFHFFVLWFMPAIFYSSKNPFIALFKATAFLFKNIKMSFYIVIVMFSLNIIISFFSIITKNTFLSFLPFLLTLLYFVYYILTVFLYYEAKTSNNSGSRSECNG